MSALREAAFDVFASLHHDWDAPQFFLPPTSVGISPDILEARAMADQSGVAQHEFFRIAQSSPDLLRLWTSQEAVVTGPFSQMLLLLASRIKNVHSRAKFLEVIEGEHGNVRDGVAYHSHPWLLYRLCVSVDLDLAAVRPLQPTLKFLAALADSFEHMEVALGVLGIGNERMLLSEYATVERCFDACMPNAEYRAFLRANVDEDEMHSAIIEAVVSTFSSPDAVQQYVEGARRGVKARLVYYDELLKHWIDRGLEPEWLRPMYPATATPGVVS